MKTTAARTQPSTHEPFVDSYLEHFADLIRALPQGEIAQLGRVLLEAYQRDAWVYIAGNGGSAALATHFACDLEKTVLGKNPRSVKKRFRVVSLSDNVAKVTAWANDEGYDCVFSEQLRAYASSEDVLVVISASGNSPNIIEALHVANEMDMVTAGLLGFGGGRAQGLCQTSVVVDSSDYGVVEGAHSVLTHLTTSWLAQAAAAGRTAPVKPVVVEGVGR